MLTTEMRATLFISLLFSFRMLGLFMILPIFTPYAHQLTGATPFLIGTALGIYGLTQAIFQLPLGALSDHYPRKMIITVGLGIFVIGSVICANSSSIFGVLIGRALQGAGAIGSTLTALLTDFIPQEKRSKSMAILGITIAFSFFIAMILGPFLNNHITVKGIFLLTALLGLLGIILLYTGVPIAPLPLNKTISRVFQNKSAIFKYLLTHPQLLCLDIGIFCLHFILTAVFIVLPLWISNWTLYIWPMIISFIFTFGLIGFAEKTKKVFRLYFYAIGMLSFAAIFLAFFHGHSSFLLALELTLFLLAFNVLEANLPSLISRIIPAEIKGTAMGIYSTSQFLGIFAGGLLGGVMYQYFSPAVILLSCAFLAIVWLILTLIIRILRRETWQEV